MSRRSGWIVNNQRIIYNLRVPSNVAKAPKQDPQAPAPTVTPPACARDTIRHDPVADALREAIADGRFEPGERLVEDRVMASLGATRGAARKAFRRLEHEGLVISYPYRGVEVLGVSAEEVQSVLIPIRLMLEQFAFTKALDAMTAADLDAIAAHLDEMERAAAAGEVDAVVDADMAFHEAVLQVVPEFHTVQIWHSIAPRIRVYFRRESQSRDLGSVVDEHRMLLEALRAGDEARLLETLEQHIKRVDGG
jgi:DNA-binding GntR family transcriptional regulator